MGHTALRRNYRYQAHPTRHVRGAWPPLCLVLALSCGCSSLLNVHSAALVNSPYPQMLLARAALGQLGIWLMLIATLLTAVMTFNGGFATASRFLYAAAREDTLPPIFSPISISYAVFCLKKKITPR